MEKGSESEAARDHMRFRTRREGRTCTHVRAGTQTVHTTAQPTPSAEAHNTNPRSTHLLLLALLNCVQLPLLLLYVLHCCCCSRLNVNVAQRLQETHSVLLNSTEAAGQAREQVLLFESVGKRVVVRRHSQVVSCMCRDSKKRTAYCLIALRLLDRRTRRSFQDGHLGLSAWALGGGDAGT